MAKIKSKGTVFQIEVSSVLTAVAQLTDMSVSGVEVETFDATTLDQSGAGKLLSQTGYTEPGEISLSGFFDPDDSQQNEITSLAATPAEFDCAIVFTDATPTTWQFLGAGISLDVTVAMGDAVKFSSTVALSSLPSTW